MTNGAFINIICHLNCRAAAVGTEQAFVIHPVVALGDVLKAAREHQLADVAAEDALGNAREGKRTIQRNTLNGSSSDE